MSDFRKQSFSGKPESKAETKPAVEIKGFYKHDKIPFIDLFDSKALEVAQSLVGKNNKGNLIGVSSTQLRRIYDEVKRYEQILSQPNAKWEEQLPYIKMIKSKLAYSVARQVKNKPEEKGVYTNLEKFLSSSINLIKDKEDFQVFLSLFEAVYGFYYELAPKSAQ